LAPTKRYRLASVFFVYQKISVFAPRGVARQQCCFATGSTWRPPKSIQIFSGCFFILKYYIIKIQNKKHLMKFFITILFIVLGALIVIKTEWIVNNWGYNGWAEGKFAAWGGTRSFYKLIGIVMIIFSLLYITGFLESILTAIFVPSIGR
jgi:hypothetical protein